MKNLFKNLMLVAVAAMAFTACTETNDEVNAVSKKTVIKGVATIDNNGDDTRSAFGDRVEDENGNFYYESNWEGGEYIRLHFSAGFSDYAEVDANGNFEIEYIGDFDPGTTATICSPDDSWSNVNTFVIPSEQTPLKNSVDPLAHILKSDATEIVNNTISATMKHMAAYGKMTVNAPDFVIKKVEVSFNGGQVYTLNAKNVVDNVFWFAVDSAIEVSTFTVTAYDAEDNAITKTVDVVAAGKELKFQLGHVSTFSVSGLEAVVAPEEPGVLELVSATAVHSAPSLIGGTGYDLTFTDAKGNTILYRVQTKDHTYLRVGDWNGNFGWAAEGFVDAVIWTGVAQPWPYSMTVAVVDDAYDITLNTNDYKNDNKAFTAHFAGQIEGFTLPQEEEVVVLPEFVIPGEGGSYTYDYKYTSLVDGLDESNGIRVAQANGNIWDIKFNPGLSEIVAGDYTATQYFSSESALEVDTYNGGFQIPGNYIYPDDFDKVTTFNVQKEGDFYCITLIGSGGFGSNGASYRLVYIGKIINE